jgi:hypothetical protein
LTSAAEPGCRAEAKGCTTIWSWCAVRCSRQRVFSAAEARDRTDFSDQFIRSWTQESPGDRFAMSRHGRSLANISPGFTHSYSPIIQQSTFHFPFQERPFEGQRGRLTRRYDQRHIGARCNCRNLCKRLRSRSHVEEISTASTGCSAGQEGEGRAE